MLSRRGFFGAVVGAIAAARSGIRVPLQVFKPRAVGPSLLLADIDRVTRARILPGISAEFFKGDPLLAYLKAKSWHSDPIPENFIYRKIED